MNGILVTMKPNVNSQLPEKRAYDVTRRRAAAAQTRQDVITAARTLFLARGYSGTTMPVIAEAAGVALDTVYASVGPKPELFRLLVELAISGQDVPVPAEERDYVQAIRNEPDPRQKIELYAHAVAEIQSRIAPLFRVLQEAAQSESGLEALWNEIAQRRAANMRLFVTDVAEAAGGLRGGLTIDTAADLVWATNGPEFFTLLVDERGWDRAHFEERLADLWIRLLLP